MSDRKVCEMVSMAAKKPLNSPNVKEKSYFNLVRRAILFSYSILRHGPLQAGHPWVQVVSKVIKHCNCSVYSYGRSA